MVIRKTLVSILPPVVVGFTRNVGCHLGNAYWPFAHWLSQYFSGFWETLFVACIIALRPLVTIRFGMIRSERIGHFCIDTEAYLCSRDREHFQKPTIDIFKFQQPICNRQLQIMWSRVLKIYPDLGVLRSIDIFARGKLEKLGNGYHLVTLGDRARDYKLLPESAPHLRFTSNEQDRGENLLQQLGIPSNSPWVCIHNRDSAYLQAALPIGSWSYHDYRDFSVQTLELAALELAHRGYFVVRMGAIATESLSSNNPRIIDYVHHQLRSDFADIYLLANCYFYLGSDSGIFAVPAIFRRPFAFINFTSITSIIQAYPWNSTPFILKRFFSRQLGRNLTLKETFEAKLDRCYQTHQFDEAGIDLVCNTPEEICDLAIEVDARLKNKWFASPEDEQLQEQFWNITRHYYNLGACQPWRARIGTSFLRNNIDLIS